MHIRKGVPADSELLFDIWHRSVQETHSFVREEDVQAFIPLVREYLASKETEFWVLVSHEERPVGFMGMLENTMEALFLAPEYHRRGGGRLLVDHAKSLHEELLVDVNEQNQAACRFYEACGFVVEGRSPLDQSGRPYPLLHMRFK